MEKDGTWGDHLILRAAANCTRIRVISSLDCDVSITPDHVTVDNTTPLVLGHIHEKHYVSLQPTQGKLFLCKFRIFFSFNCSQNSYMALYLQNNDTRKKN